MTIRSTRRTSADFEVGTQYLTSDGKLVTLKHVCIEEDRPKIDISDAKKGDTFVLRCGERFVCNGELYHCGSVHSHRALDPDGTALWFRFNGSCPSYGPRMEVVELIKADVPLVPLEGLGVGDQFRVRNGEVFTCIRLDSYGSPILAKSYEHPSGIYFRFDGRTCPFKEELEAVERLTPAKPCISLEALAVGGRFRTRDGQVFTCTRIDNSSPHAIYACSERYSPGLYFLRDGRCNLFESPLEAVEILEPSVLETIRHQILGVDKAKIGHIIVSQVEWRKLEEEVKRKGYEPIYIDGVEILFSTNDSAFPSGSYDIRMKLN